MSDKPQPPSGVRPERRQRPNTAEETARAAFARALARAVFGRHYWDETMERERIASGRKMGKSNTRERP